MSAISEEYAIINKKWKIIITIKQEYVPAYICNNYKSWEGLRKLAFYSMFSAQNTIVQAEKFVKISLDVETI